MSSKDVGIRIRVERELREAFQQACAAENRQASDLLREFMRSYSVQKVNGLQIGLFTAAEPRADYRVPDAASARAAGRTTRPSGGRA